MNNNKITYNQRDFKAYSRSTAYIQKQTNRLLGYSLFWLGIAILFIGLLTFAILSIDALFDLYQIFVFSLFSSIATIILITLLILGLNFWISWYIGKNALAEKPSTVFLGFLFFVFIIINSLTLPLFFAFQIIQGNSSLVMLAVAGAGVIMAVVGALGYFNIINFGKLLPLIIAGIVIQFVIGLATHFIFSTFLETLYSIIGITVTLVIIGYEFWLIRNQSCQILAFYTDEAEIKRVFFRIAIWNALGLYISFIRLVIFITRIMASRY
ncbi:hypothetical protein DR087_00820 [Mycoplasma hyopneumoniae]|uniref:MAG0110 family membrane protein n=1 Tax=Mesomycoplasma hyopneumoniae TaxID=2099 RepID=UPI00136E0CEF|nr:Bax inhibitor-1 family protein [Mesomycoplasma hyopneumoniae]MXR44275.1 hypothetical protein [Mesomycoplasma hyopneumoniae]